MDTHLDVIPFEVMPGRAITLSFHVEDRGGVMMVVHDDNTVRPASVAEVELWNIVTKRFSNVRESYIRVSEQDMLELVTEREHLRRQVGELQGRGTELVEANRTLRRENEGLKEENTKLKTTGVPREEQDKA